MDASTAVGKQEAAERPQRRSLHRFANPGRFLRLAAKVQPWLTAPALVLTAAGLFWGLFLSPADYQQGDAVRIMYIHVPCAWLATAGYTGLAAASFMSLVWRHPLADMAAAEIGPVGAAVTALCLATGSLWGKPMWGAWWVWDARLTSVLVLFFLYCGHIMLIRAFDDTERGARAGAILALVGVVNLPIIHFSVQWWNTLHRDHRVQEHGRADAVAAVPLGAGMYVRVYGGGGGAAAGGGDGTAAARASDGAGGARRMINPLHYDHLPFIAAAYGLFFGVTLYFAVGASRRLALVSRRLKAADPRARRNEVFGQ